MRIRTYQSLARLALLLGDIHLAGAITRLAIERTLKDQGGGHHSFYKAVTQLRSDGVLTVSEWRKAKRSYGKLSAACHCRNIHRDSIVKAMRVTAELKLALTR